MDNLNILTERIKNKEKTLLVFDYDGTLTPIKPRPDLAKLNPALRDALENIAKLNFLKICIVTGREINNFKKVSGLSGKNITIFGVHGGEIEQNNKIKVKNLGEGKTKILKNFFDELNSKCGNLEGIIVEDKKYSVALHYRMANEPTSKQAIDLFNQLEKKYNTKNSFKVQAGKELLEFLPVEFTKNEAVKKIVKLSKNYVPFYFGDDITDISAFKEVQSLSGYAVGIKPLPFKEGNLVNFEITQSELEKFLISLNCI